LVDHEEITDPVFVEPVSVGHVFVEPVIPAEAGIARLVPVESSVHVDMITVPVNTSGSGISHPVFVIPVSMDPVIPAEVGISVPVFVTHGTLHTSSVREIVRTTLSRWVQE
jgi:hypothetical protein